MKGKRSKQYRKLMQQYGMTFGFREPYQVLSMLARIALPNMLLLRSRCTVDAQIIQDTERFKMNLVGGAPVQIHDKCLCVLGANATFSTQAWSGHSAVCMNYIFSEFLADAPYLSRQGEAECVALVLLSCVHANHSILQQ